MLSFFLIFKTFRDTKQAYDELKVTQEKIIDELSGSIVFSLWNYDLEQTKTIIDLKLKTRDFVGMIIRDIEKDSSILGLIKNKDGVVENFNIDEKQYIKISRDLYMMVI